MEEDQTDAKEENKTDPDRDYQLPGRKVEDEFEQSFNDKQIQEAG